MKKLMLIVLSVIAALSIAFTGVYAEPETAEQAPAAEQAEQAQQAEPKTQDDADKSQEQSEQPKETETEVFMTLNVKLDASSDFTFRQFVTDDVYSYYEKSKDQAAASYEQMGMKLNIGEDNGKKFVELKGASGSGDPISFSSRGGSDASFRFASVKGFFGTKYFVTSNFDSRTSTTETASEDAKPFANLTMNLPIGASYSDASVVANGGKTLTWNIAEGRINPVSVMFTIPNITNIAICVGLLIILILVIVFVILGKKKSKLSDAEIVEDTLNHLEGETEDEFVDDPFASMTDDEIASDIEDEPVEEVSDEPAQEDKEEE